MPICHLEILDSDWLILFVHLLRNIYIYIYIYIYIKRAKVSLIKRIICIT